MQRLIRSVVALLSVVAATAVYSAGAFSDRLVRPRLVARRVRTERQCCRKPGRRLRPRTGRLADSGRGRTRPAGSAAFSPAPSSTTPHRRVLTYDRANDLLFAANAGSNSVSVFAVHDDQLTLEQVICVRRRLPRERDGEPERRLRAQREERWLAPRLSRALRPPLPAPRLDEAARARPRRIAGVHQHAGTGALLAGRPPTARHHQGERQCDRRIRGRRRRLPQRLAARECRLRAPSRLRRRSTVRGTSWLPRQGRTASRPSRWLPTGRSRSSAGFRRARRRPAGSCRQAVLLRIQRGQCIAERFSGRTRRSADPARQHADRCRNGGRRRFLRRALHLRPGRRDGEGRRLRDHRRRRTRSDRHGHRPRSGRRRGDRRALT